MNSIYSKSGNLIQDQHEILKETENHFKTLYSHKETDEIDLENSIHLGNKRKLSENEKISMEGALTYEELKIRIYSFFL